MEKGDVERIVEELFRRAYEIEDLVKEPKAEMTLRDDNYPGGSYLVVSRTVDGAVAIERGCYGQWQEVLKIHREEKEL